MIGYLSGRLRSKSTDGIVVDVGGVGYLLLVSLSTLADLPPEGGDAELVVHTHVREDALTLFGFSRAGEKELFLRLISVAGVGPRVALAVLSGGNDSQIRDAVRQGNTTWLTRIQGIGKKTAERIIVELRDKLEPAAADSSPTPSPLDGGDVGLDVVSALTNLGYRQQDAEGAVAEARKALDTDEPGFERLLKLALGSLGR